MLITLNPFCSEKCPPLHPVNVDLKCFRLGREIDCQSEEALINGTQVIPKCKPFYTKQSQVNFRHLTCLENGNWDEELFKCHLGNDCWYVVALEIISNVGNYYEVKLF